ncbi:beta-galactosidase [Paenibacillus sp. GCM10028914]|uniref:beta-galactosidase n=1 Tax=Paenibacillus sp. GCM10028914 TaxID=3273416 RepID=UPI003612DB92
MLNTIEFDKFVPVSGSISIQKQVDQYHVQAGKMGGELRLETPEINWTDYEYLQFDLYHESHDVLVVVVTFEEEERNGHCKRIEIHVGTLPYVRTRICVPLAVVNGQKLFLKRFPGMMQCVLRGDDSIDPAKIKAVSLTSIPSVNDREWTMGPLYLSQVPLEQKNDHLPYIDSMGQCLHKNWPEKMQSEEELMSFLQGERNSVSSSVDNGYGGWNKLQFESTGFFRTQYDDGRWWLVDPDGYALFSAGMDCVRPHSETSYEQVSHLFPKQLQTGDEFQEAVSERGYDFAVANLIKAFGETWKEEWAALTKHRLISWGFNTIANWSDPEFIEYAQMPFVYPMDNYPSTEHLVYRDFPDVFCDTYEQRAQQFAEQLLTMRDNRYMVGYFMRNEPHWAFVDDLCLSEMLLKNPAPLKSKQHLIEWLSVRYGSIEELNKAWASQYDNFDQILTTTHDVLRKPDVREVLQQFDRIMIRRYVEIPALACRKAAPNHMNLGMRYAFISRPEILEGCEYFDVFSLNAYQLKPDEELVQLISNQLNMPVMIGEFHFGATDVGMLASGIRAFSTQEERGQAYRYYVEQAAANPNIIGVHYFQWNDQPVLGRFDGENYQIGVVDVCQQPYMPFVSHMMKAHDNIYAVRSGSRLPYSDIPQEIPKTGF